VFSSQITAFAPLLDRIDLNKVLLTADALHTQRGHVEYLHVRGGHYLLIAKANQPRLHAQLVGLPWQHIPVADQQHDRGHGRVETLQVKITALGAGIEFPHARLAVEVQRRRRPIGSTRWSSETVYAITSLAWHQARGRSDRRRPTRALADRGAALDPRRVLRRGPIPGPHG
jgi:hypothetical protein